MVSEGADPEPESKLGLPPSIPQRSSQAALSVKEVVSGQRSDTYYSRLPFLDLHHYRDKGEKLGQPFNKEQGVSNNSSNSTQAEERSLQSALSHGPCRDRKHAVFTLKCQGSKSLRLTVGRPGIHRLQHLSGIKGLQIDFFPFEVKIHLDSV